MRMPALAFALAAALLLPGCKEEAAMGAAALTGPVPAARSVPAAPAALAVADAARETGRTESDWLAYRHGLRIETRDVDGAFARTREACIAEPGCRLLSASLMGGDMPTAHLSMRMPRDRVGAVRAAAVAEGTLLSSATSAEERTPEVADIEARRAMLASHRGRLVEIQGRAAEVGGLMQIARELARVQSEIERLDGRFRVIGDETSTDLLDVSLATPMSGGRWHAPMLRGLDRLPAEFAGSVGTMLVLLVALVPWLIPASLAAMAARRLLRPRRRSDRPSPGGAAAPGAPQARSGAPQA